MTTATADEDKLLAVVDEVCADLGFADDFRDACLEALEASQYTSMLRLIGAYGGAFSAGEAASVVKFAALVAAQNRPPAVAGVLLDTFVSQLSKRCRQELASQEGGGTTSVHSTPQGTPNLSSPDTRSKEDLDDLASKDAYEQMFNLHGLRVALGDRMCFVGAAAKSVLTCGYISKIGLSKGLQVFGAGASTRTHQLSNNTILQVDDGLNNNAIVGRVELLQRATIILRGLQASVCIPITETAFNARDIGWVKVPGKVDEVRLLCTRDAMDRLIARTLTLSTQDPACFFTQLDAILDRFLYYLHDRRKHVDEFIDHMLDMEGNLFIAKQPGTATVAGAADPAPAAASGTAGTTASNTGTVCASWLQNGACNKDNCDAAHPPNLSGIAHGTSQRPKSQKGWGHNGHNGHYGAGGGSWYQTHAPDWYSGGKGGGGHPYNGKGGKGGKGGGKGGKGGGGKSGGKWKWK